MNTAVSQQLIFTNGTIYIDADRKINNLLVENGKVKGYDVNPASYEDAKIIDLKGGFAYPGFIDSHVHLVAMATVASGVMLNDISKAEDIARVIAEKNKELPEGLPILGIGFMLKDYDAWSLEDLAYIDKAVPNRPVFLADQTGHSYVVNSVAMKESGLTEETLDPPGGKIVRQNGKPTGMLRENAGYLVGNKAIWPFIPDEMLKDNLLKFFNLWASMGYTSILELMGGPMGRILKPELCKKMENEGTLPLRVNYALCVYDLDDINELDNNIKDTDMVRFAGLKLFVDGAIGNGGAWSASPNTLGGYGLYGVCADNTYGEKYNINKIVDAADKKGLDVHYHVQGDLAIEIVLKAIENVLAKNGKLNSVHTFYHLGLESDDQIERMKKLGKHIVAGVQPAMHWGFMKQTLIDFYAERGRTAFPYKKIKEAGIQLAFSSDFPSNRVEYCGPSANMGVLLTGGGDPVSHPPLKMKDIIEGFTVDGRATTCMKDFGSLDVGYNADIVVYDKDLYSVAPEEFNKDNPKVMSTWIGGCKAYDSQ